MQPAPAHSAVHATAPGATKAVALIFPKESALCVCLTVISLATLVSLVPGVCSGAGRRAQAGGEAPQRFDIEAHRGGRALRPENTLQSFAHALSMGVDTLELDMGVTKDGIVVVSHERGLNPDLARAEHGRYVAAPGTPFVKLTLRRVKKYDVGQIRPGSDYAGRFPSSRRSRARRYLRSPRCLPWCAAPAIAMCASTSRPRSTRIIRTNPPTRSTSWPQCSRC